ncbi:MAG: MarR family transcriptional regulator [Cyclobacteriaceae bacterium]|jgi:DNA-binding MarR family transcriptional regulator|nr:MarR family transcriptional regulator [Cyclobacteriaceae bacterium]
MALEQDIQQEKFQSEHQKAAINILFTGNWLHNKNAAFLKDFSLSPEQFNVLRILRGSHPKPLKLADIACRMLDKNSNATRLVEKLRTKGLVKREICKTNRRQVDISVTARGLALLTKIDQSSDAWQGILKNLSKSESKQLNDLLDKLRG